MKMESLPRATAEASARRVLRGRKAPKVPPVVSNLTTSVADVHITICNLPPIKFTPPKILICGIDMRALSMVYHLQELM